MPIFKLYYLSQTDPNYYIQLILKVSRVLQDPGLNIFPALEEIKFLRQTVEKMSLDSSFYDDLYEGSQHIEEHGENTPSVETRKLTAHRDGNWRNQFLFKKKKVKFD